MTLRILLIALTLIATAVLARTAIHPQSSADPMHTAAASTPLPSPEAREVLKFWREAGPALWFAKDARIRRALSRTLPARPRSRGARRDAALAGHARRRAGAGHPARPVPAQCLSRHAAHVRHRRAGPQGGQHRAAAGYDQQLPRELRKFFVLPFAHSEDLADQERSVALARRIGPDDLAHAEHHRDIVRRFGRFPHRNKILGRESTPEEKEYLDNGGYSG